MSATMPDDRSFHVLDGVAERLVPTSDAEDGRGSHLQKTLSANRRTADSLLMSQERCGHGGWVSRFFNFDERLAALSAKGDDLERVKALVSFEMFRPTLDAAVPRSDRTV